MKNKAKKTLSFVLALLLCVGLLPMAAFAEEPGEEPITYVALGDSMSQGYMFLDYNEDSSNGHYCGWQGSSNYGYIKEFAKELEEDAKAPVNLIDLTIQGEQPDEICAFLEGYTREQIDTMTKGARKHIGWWVGDYATDQEQSPDPATGEGAHNIFSTFKEMSQYFIDSIKAADVITYDLGMNYFGTYLTDARGEDETIDNLKLNPLLSLELKTFRALLTEFLSGEGAQATQKQLDAILYSYASYLKYTEQSLGDIYALNPDVEVILIPLANPHRELYIDMGGSVISYTDLIDLMMSSLNNYIKTRSAYRDKFTVAKLNGKVISFADELYYYPNDLSPDAKALLQKTVLGYSGILGYADVAVPEKVQALYEELVSYQMGVESILADYKDEETGKVMDNGLVFDHLVYNYIAEGYGEETAYNDFYGANFCDWFWDVLSTGGANVKLDSGLVDDSNNYKHNLYYCSTTIHDYNVDRARAAIAAGTAEPWQEHLIEAIDALLVNWEGLCLKAATYRTMPSGYLSGDMATITMERVIELLAHPELATDDELIALHAGIRNGQAARGFGAHPCPRGLEVKHAAVLDAYKQIRANIGGVKNDLVIHYVYAADGSKAGEDYSSTVAINAPYEVKTPEIEGFIVDKTVVTGTMGAEPVEVTVTYHSLNEGECYKEEIVALSAGDLNLRLNGKDMGKFTFAKSGSNWTIKNSDGKYLTVSNGKLAYSSTADTAWTFKNNAFSTAITTTSGNNSSYTNLLGYLFGLLSRTQRTTTTTYYLECNKDVLSVSTSTAYSKAEFYKVTGSNGQHVPGEKQITNVVKPTCTKAGSHDEVYTCTVCGKELIHSYVVDPALEHTPGEAVHENVQQASCDVAGTYDEVIYCSVCGEELGRESKEIPAGTHTPATAVRENEVAATCTVNGSYDEVVYCSECGDVISRENKTITAAGHKTGVAAKETIDGIRYNVVRCTKCHEILSKEEIAGEITANVSFTSSTSQILWIFNYTTYNVKINAESTIPGVTISKVQFSSNNRTWTTGTSYTATSAPRTLYIKITCSDNSVYNFVYSNGITTAK